MNVSLDSVRALPAQQNEGFPGPDRVDHAKALEPQRLEVIRLEPGDEYTTVGKTVQVWKSVAEAKLESFQPEEMQHPSYQQFKDCVSVLNMAALQLSQEESQEVYVCRDSVTGQIHGIMIQIQAIDPYQYFISVLATNPINIRSPKNILENQSARGAGTILMNRAEKEAIKLNKRSISLNSTESAKEFYKRLGFSSANAWTDEMTKKINEMGPNVEVIRLLPGDVYPTVEKIVKAWDFVARTNMQVRNFQPGDPPYQSFIDCMEALEILSVDITHKWLDESEVYVCRNSATKEIQGIMLMQRNRPNRYDSFIQMLAINPTYLRLSKNVLEIGTALVNRAEKEANKLDKRTLSLVPPPSAIEFYQGLDFSSPFYGDEMSKKLTAFHPIRAFPAALDPHRMEVTRLTLDDVYPIVRKIVRSWDFVARAQLESFQPEEREGPAYQQCADCVETLEVIALDVEHEWLDESEVFVCRDSVTGQEHGIMTMQRNRPNRYDSFITALVTNPLENHYADNAGTALVNRAEKEANTLDKRTLSLVPPPSTREFYEGLGFSSPFYTVEMSKKLRHN